MKNLSPVGGISLLARSITTARTAGFQDITVSTDHPLIALEALKCKYVLITKNTKLLSVLPVCDASSSFSYILFMLMNLSFVMARFFLLKIVYLIFFKHIYLMRSYIGVCAIGCLWALRSMKSTSQQ